MQLLGHVVINIYRPSAVPCCGKGRCAGGSEERNRVKFTRGVPLYTHRRAALGFTSSPSDFLGGDWCPREPPDQERARAPPTWFMRVHDVLGDTVVKSSMTFMTPSLCLREVGEGRFQTWWKVGARPFPIFFFRVYYLLRKKSTFAFQIVKSPSSFCSVFITAKCVYLHITITSFPVLIIIIHTPKMQYVRYIMLKIVNLYGQQGKRPIAGDGHTTRHSSARQHAMQRALPNTSERRRPRLT